MVFRVVRGAHHGSSSVQIRVGAILAYYQFLRMVKKGYVKAISATLLPMAGKNQSNDFDE